ncbi:CGNR zinc finger domain-containing protein [Streptomyces sp. NPDC054796]
MTDRTAPASLVLVQELVNTLDVETGEDALAAPDGLGRFARRHGLTDLALTGGDLPAVTELREGLRSACVAHTGAPMDSGAARVLERRLGAAPLVLGLDGAGAAALRPAEGLLGVDGLAARVAAGIAAADAGGQWQRLKACEAEDCLWVFYDRSPAGRGRWCTMAVCGSRAKMRAYRSRRP